MIDSKENYKFDLGVKGLTELFSLVPKCLDNLGLSAPALSNNYNGDCEELLQTKPYKLSHPRHLQCIIN